MYLIGLTGSIGMGKSATARLFQQANVPVYDADAAVHALYEKGGAAVAPIGALVPEAIIDGAVDRAILGQHVLKDAEKLKALEAIVHPLAGQSQFAFLSAAQAEGAPVVVLDIPLLFETGGEAFVDCVVVVSAPFELQRQRVLARDIERDTDGVRQQAADLDRPLVLELQHAPARSVRPDLLLAQRGEDATVGIRPSSLGGGRGHVRACWGWRRCHDRRGLPWAWRI